MLSLAETPSPPPRSEFTEHFEAARADLTRYVYSLTRDPDAVQDILQELALALWHKYEEYDCTRPFLPWACRFAFFQVLKHRQRTQRRGWLLCDDALLEQATAPTQDEWQEARHLALETCLKELPSEDQELIQCRYGSRETIQQMAKRTQISVHKLYHALDRIREDLLLRITRTMRAQGWEC